MASDIRFQFLNQLLVFGWGATHMVQIVDIVVAGSRTLLSLHHGTYRIFHALLDQIVWGDRQRRQTTVNTILLKPVPIVKLFLEILNLQIHNYLYRSPNVFKHLEPTDFLKFWFLLLQNLIRDLVQLLRRPNLYRQI